ncbi:MAG: hypothetical protein ABI972_27780, partial [Acidobacteriota bacterium]
GYSNNDQSSSLLLDWRRPKGRFGVRLEFVRGIQDNWWPYRGQAGCGPRYSSPAFGKITNTLNDGRVFQFTLRLTL